MGGDPKDEGLGNLSGFTEAMIQSYNTIAPDLQLRSFRTNPLNANTLNSLTNQYFGRGEQNLRSELGSNISQAGQLASGRGYSLGLSNPFAYAQHAENQARGAFGDQYGRLEAQRLQSLLGNQTTAFNSSLQSNQANFAKLLQLLQFKGGVVGQREGNIVQEQVLPGLISGIGTIGGAVIGGPAGALAGSQLGQTVQDDPYRNFA